MSDVKKLQLPLTIEQIKSLRAGDKVELTGVIYTGRDAAHKRLVELLANNEPLPIDVNGGAIYYVGPTPAKPGRPIGSCGPTSSYRMDPYAPTALTWTPSRSSSPTPLSRVCGACLCTPTPTASPIPTIPSVVWRL